MADMTREEAIDWLTQEAESETYNEEQIDNMFTEEEKYKMTHACKFYGNQCGSNCDGLNKNCEIRREYEPQNKARFIKDTDGILHQIKDEDISEIKKDIGIIEKVMR